MLLNVVLAGCVSQDPAPAVARAPTPDEELIVPGRRVGRFVIGQDTMTSILGSDAAQARRMFAARGLYFEFEQGRQLTGITVDKPAYATQQGSRVGSTAIDVESVLGAPADRVLREAHGKFEWPALKYPGIWFLLKEGTVCAIRVGSP
jgi:hypothetical protein